MNNRHLSRVLPGLLVVVVTFALGAVFEWPLWWRLVLPALLAAAVLVTLVRKTDGEAVQHTFGAVRQPVPVPAPGPPPQPPYLEEPVSGIPVSSALADYPFLFSATVRWRPAGGGLSPAHANPASLAVSAVLRRAQEVTASEHPSRSALVRTSLEGLLGAPAPDETGLVTAFAANVRLALNPGDQERLDELEELRKSAVLWDSRREQERLHRAYLGDDVLKTPGSAVVWWLTRHEDEIEDAVRMMPPLICLSAAANDLEVPEEYRYLWGPPERPVGDEPNEGSGSPTTADEHLMSFFGPGEAGREGPQTDPSGRLATVLDEMGLARESGTRAAFVHRLAKMTEAAGKPDMADRIRRDLLGDAAATAPPSGEADDGVHAQGAPEADTGQFAHPEATAETTARGGANRDRGPGEGASGPGWWEKEVPPESDPLEASGDSARVRFETGEGDEP